MTGATLVAGSALNILFAAVALRRRALTPAGAVAGAGVGLGIFWSGGPALWSLLAIFFVSSTLLSAVGRPAKASVESLTGKGDRRDAAQVLANGGPALLAAFLWRVSGAGALAVGAAAALAAANADTWASELGLLSRRGPVSILGLRPVPRGRSGGVTPLGLVASAAGAALVASGFVAASAAGGLMPIRAALGAGGLVAACGVLGSLVDSLLGGTLQGTYAAADTGEYTERPRSASGHANVRTGGVRVVTNDLVNFLSGLVGAAAAVGISCLL